MQPIPLPASVINQHNNYDSDDSLDGNNEENVIEIDDIEQQRIQDIQANVIELEH